MSSSHFPKIPKLIKEILKIPYAEVIRNDYEYCLKNNLPLYFEYVYFALEFNSNLGGFIFDIVWDRATDTCDFCWLYMENGDYDGDPNESPYYHLEPLEFLLEYWEHREILPFYLNLLQERNGVPC